MGETLGRTTVAGPIKKAFGFDPNALGATKKKPGISFQAASAEQQRQDLSRDVTIGRAFGESIVGEGSLGRTSTQVIEARQRLAKGLTAPEVQAQRDVASQQINRQTQGSQRQLAALQARLGVRGGTAGAQQAGILQTGIQARAGFERDLLLRQRGAEFEGLAGLEESQRFDLAQASREKFAQLSTGLAFGQLGATGRGASEGIGAQLQAAQIQAGANKGKK